MRRGWREKDWELAVSERPSAIVPEDKDRSFFLADDSKDWRLPIAPAIGSFTLCSSTVFHQDAISSGLPTRLIDAILVSVQNTQELFLGYTGPVRVPKGHLFGYWSDFELDRLIDPRGQNCIPIEGEEGEEGEERGSFFDIPRLANSDSTRYAGTHTNCRSV